MRHAYQLVQLNHCREWGEKQQCWVGGGEFKWVGKNEQIQQFTKCWSFFSFFSPHVLCHLFSELSGCYFCFVIEKLSLVKEEELVRLYFPCLPLCMYALVKAYQVLHYLEQCQAGLSPFCFGFGNSKLLLFEIIKEVWNIWQKKWPFEVIPWKVIDVSFLKIFIFKHLHS